MQDYTPIEYYESLGIICRSERHAQTHADACMWQGRFEKASGGY